MTTYVEWYRVCKRCTKKSVVKYSHGVVGVDGGGGCKSAHIYPTGCDTHLCEVCSEELIQWMEGVGE